MRCKSGPCSSLNALKLPAGPAQGEVVAAAHPAGTDVLRMQHAEASVAGVGREDKGLSLPQAASPTGLEPAWTRKAGRNLRCSATSACPGIYAAALCLGRATSAWDWSPAISGLEPAMACYAPPRMFLSLLMCK